MYSVLIFEPEISPDYRDSNILWKAQLDISDNYVSIISTIIHDNISFNNRRKLEDWYKVLDDSNIKYMNRFDSDYCKELVIYDDDFKYYLQLFACDIRAGNYNIEIDNQNILSTLFILDLKRSGKISPYSLIKKIKVAKDLIVCNEDSYNNSSKIILNYLKQIEKLVDHCQNYEHDIKYYVYDRS